jgi:hypothetical protein
VTLKKGYYLEILWALVISISHFFFRDPEVDVITLRISSYSNETVFFFPQKFLLSIDQEMEGLLSIITR